MKHKEKKFGRRLWQGAAAMVLSFAMTCLVLPGMSLADDFDDYGNYEIRNIVLPEVEGGWFDAIDYFPKDTVGTIGPYEAEGRLLVANYQYIYLQKNYGAGADMGTWNVGDPNDDGLPGGHDNWIKVARVTPYETVPPGLGSMDPSFIKISPDGQTIALGMGYFQPLLVFPVTMLDPDDPPLLNGEDGHSPMPGVRYWQGGDPPAGVLYYDAEWVDNERLAMNWGVIYIAASHVYVLDTTDSSNTPVTVIDNILGASADVTVDNNLNMITGNGFNYAGDEDTGQIKIFFNAQWEGAYSSGTPVNYDTDTKIIADNALSAAQLGVDEENNLHVGGGSWLGEVGDELGYAALIEEQVLTRVLAGGAPVNESNPDEYKELAPDPMANDSATSPVNYSQWAEGLSVCWNPMQMYGSIPGSDLWSSDPPVKPILTTYYVEGSADQDGDGVPDGSDNAWLTPNPGQEDTDGDGWANAADADFDNDGDVGFGDYSLFKDAYGTSEGDPDWNPDTDMDSDGEVYFGDYSSFKDRYGSGAPFY